jgi:hypothetical protein
VTATYSGDSTHASSTGSATVNVPVVSSGSGTFALSATNLKVAQGSSGSSTITITPAGGYTGTVELTFDTSNDNALTNLCYSFTNTNSAGDGTAIVSNSSAVTTQLTFDTNAADCATAGAARKGGKLSLRNLHRVNSARNSNDDGKTGSNAAPLRVAFAGLMLFGFVGRYARRFRTLAGVLILAAVGFGLSACGGGGTSALSDPPKGTYTVTLTGQDSTSATVPVATTTFTFVIQ